MARKSQESGDRGQESGNTPAMELDVDVSPETAGTQTSANVLKADEAVAALHNPPPQRQGDAGRPFCGQHNCLMKATSSTPETTRYACPVPLCDQKEKRARGTVQIPREPTACPDVRCRGKQSYLEVDGRRSSTAHLSMVCPNCQYEIKVPRPSFNSGRRVYEREEGDLAAR